MARALSRTSFVSGTVIFEDATSEMGPESSWCEKSDTQVSSFEQLFHYIEKLPCRIIGCRLSRPGGETTLLSRMASGMCIADFLKRCKSKFITCCAVHAPLHNIEPLLNTPCLLNYNLCNASSPVDHTLIAGPAYGALRMGSSK